MHLRSLLALGLTVLAATPTTTALYTHWCATSSCDSPTELQAFQAQTQAVCAQCYGYMVGQFCANADFTCYGIGCANAGLKGCLGQA